MGMIFAGPLVEERGAFFGQTCYLTIFIYFIAEILKNPDDKDEEDSIQSSPSSSLTSSHFHSISSPAKSTTSVRKIYHTCLSLKIVILIAILLCFTFTSGPLYLLFSGSAIIGNNLSQCKFFGGLDIFSQFFAT